MIDPMEEQHREGKKNAGHVLYIEDKNTRDNGWLGHTRPLVQTYNEDYVSNYSADIIYKL
jgi:hypothetical protein